MKKNRIFGLASGLVLLMAGACSNDLIDPGKQNPGENVISPEDGVFMAVSFELPTDKNTRSYTDGPNSSSGGTEEGSPDENNVSSVLVVLARTTDNGFIAAGYAENEAVYPVDQEKITYRTTTKITKTALSDFYEWWEGYYTQTQPTEQPVAKSVNVFVFANPTAALKKNFLLLSDESNQVVSFGDKGWVNFIGTYDPVEAYLMDPNEEVRIWARGKFLMSNSAICERRVPETFAEWDNYNVATSAFNLTGMNNYGRPNEYDNLTNKGNIPVERTAARYDFRDGALDGGNGLSDPNNNGYGAQSYHMVLDSEGQPLVDMYLGKMSLINMNKEYYYLRRVSGNGYQPQEDSNSNDWLLGAEKAWYSDAEGTFIEPRAGNYVVDAMADWKCPYAGAPAPQSQYAGHFMYPFFTESQDATTGNNLGVLPENLNEGNTVTDNFGTSTIDTESTRWYTSRLSDVLGNDLWDKDRRYHTWRYLTEGTIPGRSAQKNSVSNGIVFKGQMRPALSGAQLEGKDYFTKLLMNTLATKDDQQHTATQPLVYVYLNHLYCSWEHVRRTAIYLSLTSLTHNADGTWSFGIDRTTRLYTAVFGTGGFGSVTFTVNGADDLQNANFLIDPSLPAGNGVFTITDSEPEIASSANGLYNAWKTAYPNSDDVVADDEEREYELFDAFRNKAVNDGKLALYQESYDQDFGGWGYFCYYYYWNRHNDNGEPGVMGPMEFAVVRNNVYKLAVTKVAAPGHPGITANDPDRPTPDTPDESGDVYITVSCQTLPWVVRVNNITF